MDVVNKIYGMIQHDHSHDAFYKNRELFKEFESYMSIKYYGPKVLEIYKYLITLPYEDELKLLFNKIFHDLNSYEQVVTQSAYSKDNKSIDDINDLIKFVDDYEFFRQYEDKSYLEKMYSHEKFVRDYTGAMIVILNRQIYDLPIEMIIKLNDYIVNNDYIISLINNKDNLSSLLSKDYIVQYIKRYGEMSKLLNGLDKNDMFIRYILNGVIKNNQLLIRALKYMKKEFKSLKEFINCIERAYDNEYERIEAFDSKIDYMVERFPIEFLELIISDNKDKNYLFSKYSLQELLKKIIENPIDELNIDEFFIEENIDKSDVNSLEAVMCLAFNKFEELRDKKDLDKKEEKFIKSFNDRSFGEMSYEEALQLLIDDVNNNYEKSMINFTVFCRILKAFAKKFNGDDLKLFLYSNDGNTLGYEISSEDVIALNAGRLFYNYINHKNYLKFSFLNTIYHESRHHQQFVKKIEIKNRINMVIEEIIRIYFGNYYDCNYKGISYEKDARVYGAYKTSEFIKMFFPNLEEHIEYYENLSKEEESIQFPNEKETFDLSKKASIREIFDLLTSLNQDILYENEELRGLLSIDGTIKI